MMDRTTKSAYTLIELITVASLSVLLLSLSATAYYRLKHPSDVETASAIFRAAASQARSYAAAKLTPCRVIVEHAPRGDKVSVERRTLTPPYKWIRASATNVLANTSVAFRRGSTSAAISIQTSSTGPVLYFRADGSCCADEVSLDLPDRQENIHVDFVSIVSSDKADGRIRSVTINPHSGLTTPDARRHNDSR